MVQIAAFKCTWSIYNRGLKATIQPFPLFPWFESDINYELPPHIQGIF